MKKELLIALQKALALGATRIEAAGDTGSAPALVCEQTAMGFIVPPCEHTAMGFRAS